MIGHVLLGGAALSAGYYLYNKKEKRSKVIESKGFEDVYPVHVPEDAYLKDLLAKDQDDALLKTVSKIYISCALHGGELAYSKQLIDLPLLNELDTFLQTSAGLFLEKEVIDKLAQASLLEGALSINISAFDAFGLQAKTVFERVIVSCVNASASSEKCRKDYQKLWSRMTGSYALNQTFNESTYMIYSPVVAMAMIEERRRFGECYWHRPKVERIVGIFPTES